MSKFPIKAYKNTEFLNSSEARTIRILCEYEEPKRRFESHGITDTVVFFGSARTKPGDVAALALEDARNAAAAPGADKAAAAALKKAEIDHKMSRYYDDARELARRITEWSLAAQSGRFVITSGGGPGIMEAANRGAADVDGGRSVGLGISLPFEAGVNDWVTDGLDFEFHYFFTRKYWFLYLCKALVIFPGGFGTMDELFESLTLIQTEKIKKGLPIVLYGKAYWDAILNMEAMAEFGTISPDDVDLFHRVDSVDDAFDYLSSFLERSAPVGSVLSRDD
jgi:hypothetical protein